MLLAYKIGSAVLALVLLTIGLSQAFSRNAARSDSSKQEVAVFVVKNEISKMQELLRDKGQYRYKIDGIFGLRTRASLRAYQKAEHLTMTGQVDAGTAAALGVRPEATWDNFRSTGRDIASGGNGGDKPSAGIRRARRRAGKTPRNEVLPAAAAENNRVDAASRTPN